MVPLEPGQVTAVLSGCDTGTPPACDLAMFTLLARLGLRAREVAARSLDDIDWRAGEIAIAGEGRRSGRLPLPADAGAVFHRRSRGTLSSPFPCFTSSAR